MTNILHSLILGQGEPLLILHGYFGMGDNWKTLGKKFAEKFQVHLIDQRNHGRSFHADDFNYKVMVEDLANYINHHNLQKVNLIGHSMGGKVVMFFATRYSERVKNLIVVDIGPKYYPPHHDNILKALSSVDFLKVKSRNEMDLILQEHIDEVGIRQFLLKNVYRKSKDRFDYRFHLKSLIENNAYIGASLPPSDQFEGPTLFLKGEYSNYITEEDKFLIAQHFPNYKLISVSRSGHWLHAENPDEFYRFVVNFLEND